MSEKDEIKIVDERIYTIPLRRAWIAPINKRAARAMRIIRSFVKKNMKTEIVIINKEVNEKVWNRGIEKPPRKIRVKTTKDEDGTVRVYLVKQK
jgi:large subunit ribosomal protein L31e